MNILDASAIIALLERESGHQSVAESIAAGAAACAVNLAEVASWLSRKGLSPTSIGRVVSGLPIRVFEVGGELALAAGLLFPATRPFGLSLGDRFCLALAARERQPVLTADRIWQDVGPLIGVTVRLVR
ncbi:MAG TPA: type II toxin-antitoxin system VapC family toxin [Acetobacteraceae bacterium]